MFYDWKMEGVRPEAEGAPEEGAVGLSVPHIHSLWLMNPPDGQLVTRKMGKLLEDTRAQPRTSCALLRPD